MLPWRRQTLQHEMQREDDENEVVQPEVQPELNLRRSTRARRQTQFIQLQEDQQSYQYREPIDSIAEEHANN